MALGLVVGAGVEGGDLDGGIWTVGQSQGLIHDIPTVKELIELSRDPRLLSVVILAFLEWRLALLAVLGTPLCLIGPRLLGPRAAREGYRFKGRQAALAADPGL
mgnify:CR=1 FL=1